MESLLCHSDARQAYIHFIPPFFLPCIFKLFCWLYNVLPVLHLFTLSMHSFLFPMHKSGSIHLLEIYILIIWKWKARHHSRGTHAELATIDHDWIAWNTWQEWMPVFLCGMLSWKAPTFIEQHELNLLAIVGLVMHAPWSKRTWITLKSLLASDIALSCSTCLSPITFPHLANSKLFTTGCWS